MAIWTKEKQRPNDKERQDAKETGVGSYGGDSSKNETLIRTTTPNTETT